MLRLVPFAAMSVALACSAREPAQPPSPVAPVDRVPPVAHVEAVGPVASPPTAPSPVAGTTAEAPAPVPPPEPGEDILAEAKAWQADPHPKPPTTFRQGHVSERQLSPHATTTSAGRFELALPSHAPLATPTVHDGKVFVSGGFHSKEFYAVDAKSGKPVWGLDLDDDGPSTAACADGICAFNTESCTLFAVAADSGKLLWSWWLGDPLTSAPAIADGRVYTSYPAPGHPKASHVIAAFDLRSGAIRWQRWIDSDVQSAPVVAGGKVFAASFGGVLYRFDAASGDIVSARRVRSTSAPTIAGGEVYFSRRADRAGEGAAEAITTADGHGRAKRQMAAKAALYLDPAVQSKSALAATGKALDAGNGFAGGAPAAANAAASHHNVGKGSVSTMQAHQGSRVLAIGNGLVAAMGDEIVCNDPASGAMLWSKKIGGDLAGAGGALVTAPAAAGGSIFVGTLAGELLRLDPKTGAVEERWSVGGAVRSQPVVEDGWIYVGTEDGKLVGIDTGNPRLTGWSTWGGDAARTGAAR